MATFHIVSTVLRIRRLCLYFMSVAACEPWPGTRRYYPPLVKHALLGVLTPFAVVWGVSPSSRGSGYHASIRQ